MLTEMAKMVCKDSLDIPPWKVSLSNYSSSTTLQPTVINRLNLNKLFGITYPGGQGVVMSLDEMNEEWWCDLPLAAFPADTVSHTKWVQYIELSSDVL